MATQPADANRARWRDWLASVEDGYHMLSENTSKVVVMGVSMGGALSLLLARDFPVSGVVVMSTPDKIPDEMTRRLRPIAPLITRFWHFAKQAGESDWHDKEAELLQVHYDRVPTRAAVELHDILEEMRNSLDRVTVPALLIYAEGDATTPHEAPQIIHERLGSNDKQIIWLKDSGHNIPRDAARQLAFEAAAAFARRVTT